MNRAGRPATPMLPAAPAVDLCADGALSPDGAAEFTSVSRDEIDRAIARSEIETFHHGRRVLIARRELVRWLAAKLDATRAVRRTATLKEDSQ